MIARFQNILVAFILLLSCIAGIYLNHVSPEGELNSEAVQIVSDTSSTSTSADVFFLPDVQLLQKLIEVGAKRLSGFSEL